MSTRDRDGPRGERSVRGEAHVAGAYEHPTREAPETSTAELHAEVVAGALDDAGLEHADVDALFLTWPPGMTTLSMAEYLGLTGLSYVGSTNTGGSSYVLHVGHAAAAIAAGKADVAVISLAGRPRSATRPSGMTGVPGVAPEDDFEEVYGLTTIGAYALAASRHMHEFGTTASPWPRTTGASRSRSAATSGLTTTRAPPPSETRQQSSRWSGSETIRDSTTSSTVTGSGYIACSLYWACFEAATRTAANCSDVVPYSCMWRRAAIPYIVTLVTP